MIHVVDNFLDIESLSVLQQQMYKRVPPHQHAELNDHRPIIVGGKLYSNKFPIETNLGTIVFPVLDKIKNYLTHEMKFIGVMEYSVYWLYSIFDREVVGYHRDGSIGNRPLTRCFTSILYTHRAWEDNYGGELCFSNQQILPKTNRLVIYSRDELHWVNKSKHNIKNFQRMAMALEWSIDNDIQ